MKMVPLEDVAELNPRAPSIPPAQAVSFVGMAQLNAEAALALPLETRSFGDVAKGYTVFRDGDLLAAKITPCWENGKVGQAHLEHSIGVGSTEFHVIRTGPDLDPRFALHFLRQPWIRTTGERRMTGSAGQRRVPVDFLRALRLPLPPRDEQRRIAEILDQADALRAKRREQLALLDSLPQAIFHEMFGDARSTVRTACFGELISLRGGRNLVADDPDQASRFRVLKISAVTSGHFDSSESKPLPSEYVPPTEHLVRPGDLLMSRANTSELVGAVAMVQGPCDGLVLPDKIWRFEWQQPNQEPLFYLTLLRLPEMRRAISRLASGTGGSMKNVSKAKLADLTIPLVSPDNQRSFAAILTREVDARERSVEATAAADRLFASLQSRAFRGEL